MPPTPQTNRRTGPRRKVDATRREELLDALTEVVLTEGFAALTIDDLTARLKCSRTTLYGIASSKQALVAQAFKRFFRMATISIEETLDAPGDHAARIGRYLTGIGAQMSRVSPACYADLVTNDITRDIYGLNARAASGRVKELIEDGVRAGELRSLNASFVGESVALLIAGIQQGDLLERTGLTSGEAFSAVGDLLLAALSH